MILAIDQGTSSTAAFVVAPNGTVAGQGRVPIAAHHPRPGWVEQDAAEIWRSVQRAARLALANAGNPPLAAIGLTNQRETAVAWDTRSGRPLAPAIVWQDRRTAQRCEALREAGWGPRIRSLTGLTIDPYFSATAYEWLLTNSDSVGQAAQRGTLRLGTVDAWNRLEPHRRRACHRPLECLAHDADGPEHASMVQRIARAVRRAACGAADDRRFGW